MNLLRRGALIGAVYGLLVVTVEWWLGALAALDRGFAPGVAFMIQGGALEVLLGTLLGIVLSPLLRLPAGGLWHPLAVTLAWVGLIRWVSLGIPLFVPMERIPPAAGLVLLLLGRLLSRRWRVASLGAVVAAFFAAVLTPGIHIRLTVPDATPDVALAPHRPDSPDVVLVVLDTVRAQSTSAYGYERDTTPTLEALAREGALFLDATSPSTWSLPSHASLFTGQFPSVHGAHSEHRFLDDGGPTLAEALARRGYDTRCFTANAWISDGLGLTRGFAWQSDAWREGGAGRSFTFINRLMDLIGFGARDKGGGAVVDSFESWLAERPVDGPPAFAFLNFLEAHFPYHQIPDEFLARFSDRTRRELRGLSLELLGQQFGGDLSDPEAAADPARAMYDAGVLYSDHLLGRVVDALRRRGSLDRTILVVLSDHGELLGEHGEFFGHGPSVYEPMIRVPLLVRYPPRVRPGVRVPKPISTVGVYATILDLAGLEAPPTLHVGSLVPLLRGEPIAEPVLSELHRRDGDRTDPEIADPLMRIDRRYRAWRLGPKKLIETSMGETFLFDLETDPTESRNLASEQPDEVRRMLARLETWRERVGLPPIDATIDRAAAPPLDPAARERLRELGYVE